MMKINILLAEDDIDDQIFFQGFLKDRADINLIGNVENGEEVLQFLARAKDENDLPDVIILDQNMPKMNGLETLRRLKAGPLSESITVVLYSTNADESLKTQCFTLGALLVCSKPSTHLGYHQMIDEILAVYSGREA